MPILRWAGGKGRLLDVLETRIPPGFLEGSGRYFEPFFGAGAFGLYLVEKYNLPPSRMIINDLNQDLINLYEVLQAGENSESFEGFWRHFRWLSSDFEKLPQCGGINCRGRRSSNKVKCSRNYDYTWIRDSFKPATDFGQAARFLFLNRTCFNGLYRVNSSGAFNVPYGHLTAAKFFSKEELLQFARIMNRLEIRNLDFKLAVEDAVAGDFVYFDPPYIALSETAQHTAYNAGGFDLGEQERLRDVVKDLVKRGVHVLVSNSNTKLTRDLYRETLNHELFPEVRRSISAKTESRGVITEYLGSSYWIP